MRILIDVLGAPEKSGGMRAYAEELVFAWSEIAPSDELVVIGGEWIREAFNSIQNLTSITLPAKSTGSRIISQLVGTARTASRLQCDAMLSVSPIVSPFFPASRRFSVIHDWRHLSQPGEFSVAQRLYRRLWKWSAASTRCSFAISEKTLVETTAIVPRANVALAENGRDQSRRWRVFSDFPYPGRRLVITFGHHSNKRPELVIRALQLLDAELRESLILVVLGAEGNYQNQLRDLAVGCSVDEYCVFPGFTSDEDYQAFIAGASVVVLVSSDEGFGMPIAEAEYFGARSLVACDSGVARLHGDGVIEVEPSAIAVSIGLQEALESPKVGASDEVVGLEVRHSWLDTARTIRMTILQSVWPGSEFN